MHANGEPEVCRRDVLRLAFSSLAWATVPPGSDGPDASGVTAIGARVRALADGAPLAMKFQGSTADDLRRWQSEFSGKLRALLGHHRPPARWDSALERTVTFEDHVREERVLSAEGVAPLPMHLLLPRDGHPVGPRARRPAVLALHGHGEFGHDSVVGRDDSPARRDEIVRNRYDYALQLVRRGYVVVAPCLTPFGRRRGGAVTGPRGVDACAQTFMGLQALGRLLIAENLRDALWALDFVAGHETVDAGRLGCVGLSYGGRLTMLVSAVEPRVRVAVISGALNCLQERVATGHASGCQTIPGLLAFGDVPEIASLIAPRPCLWEVGSRDDLIAPEWAEAALSRLRRAYRAAGAEGELRVDRFDGGHQWHGVAAYPLLDAILKPETRPR